MTDIILIQVVVAGDPRVFTFDSSKSLVNFIQSRGLRGSDRLLQGKRRDLQRGTILQYQMKATKANGGLVQYTLTALPVTGFRGPAGRASSLINSGVAKVVNPRKAKYVYPTGIRSNIDKTIKDNITVGASKFKQVRKNAITSVDTSKSEIGRLGFDKFFEDIIGRITPEAGHMYRIIITFLNEAEARSDGFALQKLFENAEEDVVEFGVSTKFLATKQELMDNLHSVYLKLVSRYNDVSIKKFTIVDQTFAIEPADIVVGAGNVEQLREFIRVMKYHTKYNGKYDRLLKAVDGHRIHVPGSYTNCFMRCFLILSGYTGTKDGLRKYASKVKKHWFGQTDKKAFTLGEYIEKIKRLKNKCGIIVRTLLGKDIEYNIEAKKVYSFLLIGDHVCAILPNKPEFDRWTTEMGKVQNVDKHIDLPSTGGIMSGCAIIKPFSPTTLAWDVETLVDEDNRCFCISVAGKEIIENFYGVDTSVIEFMEWVRKYALTLPEGSTLTMYAHNGGKFDNHFIFQYILDNPKCGFSVPNVFAREGRLINFKTSITGNHHISFSDSITLLMGSLDQLTGAGGFDVEHKKLKGSVPFRLFTREHIFKADIKARIVKYCNWDSIGLYEVMESFYMIMKDGFHIDIRRKATMSSLAKKIFLDQYYNPEIYPIYSLSMEHDRFVRESYLGGRTDVYTKLGAHKGKFYYHDYCSWYPTQMSEQNLPYGLPEMIVGDVKIRAKLGNQFTCGFIRCRVRSIEAVKLPLHGIKKDIAGTNKLIFPNFQNWTQITLFSKEIEKGLEHNLYEYIFEEAMWFMSSDFYKKCVDDVFQLKKNANQNPAKKKAMKILLNSLYGFWGINRFTKSTKVVKNQHLMYKALACGSLSNFCQFPSRECYLIEFDSYMARIESNSAIASAITSYARIGLWELMNEIEDHGGKVMYTDTDSVISTLDLEKIPFFIDKYFSNPGELGSLANEITEATKKRKRKNPDVEIRHSSDYLITIAPKFYSIYGFNKMKGFSCRPGKIVVDDDKKTITILEAGENDPVIHLEPIHYELLVKGYTVIQQNTVVFSGSISKQYFQSSGRMEMVIPVNKIVKKFRLKYDKQVIDDELNITPHNI